MTQASAVGPSAKVACPSCGKLNRLQAYSIKQTPRCGACKAPLPESNLKTLQKELYRFRYAGILGLGLAGWAAWSSLEMTGQHQSANGTPVECASRPQPKSGVYGIFSQRARLATLTIKTPPDANYMVKLDDAYTREPVMSLYVPAGTTQDVEVPIGQYVLKSASGERWCGDNELFGTSTSTSIAIETFSFASADVHWTVELIRQKSGNLRQRAIPRSEF